MFPLRCAFWLSVVYASILQRDGSLAWMSGMLQASGPAVADKLVRHGADGVAALCTSRPAACAADGARLDRLVRSALAPR